MSKSTSATATEPNKPGLPDSQERGTGDVSIGASGQPVVAGTGVQGVLPPDVVENEAAVAGKTGPAARAKKPAVAEKPIAWFRVVGPGSVKVNGAWHAPGAEIQLARAEALSVNEYLEEIDSPS